MMPQDFCALPWCGRAYGAPYKKGPDGEYPEGIHFHHWYGREHSDLGGYICKECHADHHDGRRVLNVAWAGGQWIVEEDSDTWTGLVVADPDDPLHGLGSKIRRLADEAKHHDYALSRLLLSVKAPRADIEEFCVDELGISPKGVGGWLTKRLSYGALEGEGVDTLGVTNGYKIARLVEAGHDLTQLLEHFYSMPRAQFDEEYRTTPKRARVPRCGACGSEMVCQTCGGD